MLDCQVIELDLTAEPIGINSESDFFSKLKLDDTINFPNPIHWRQRYII